VQGTDYAYTLQGWIKATNSNALNSATDMGHDSEATNINSYFAKDVASFSLHYFNSDYSCITPQHPTSLPQLLAVLWKR